MCLSSDTCHVSLCAQSCWIINFLKVGFGQSLYHKIIDRGYQILRVFDMVGDDMLNFLYKDKES